MLRREPCAESLLTQWTLAGRVTSEHSSCLEVSCVAESLLTQRTLAASALVSHLDLMNQNTQQMRNLNVPELGYLSPAPNGKQLTVAFFNIVLPQDEPQLLFTMK